MTISISKYARSQASFLQLLQAARGKQRSSRGEVRNPPFSHTRHKYGRKSDKYELPCFPLYPEHIRIIPSSSSKNESESRCKYQHKYPQVSTSPREFHEHLCKSIQNAKRRVKLATLYIGAGNGCMSMPMSDKNHIDSERESSSSCSQSHSPREEKLLQHLRELSIRNQENNTDDDVEIKIIMDASRALRPIKLVTASKEDSIENDTTYTISDSSGTTTSAKEVFYALFPKGKKNKIHSNHNYPHRKVAEKGVSLFNIHSGLTASLPSPLSEILGVFHLKVYIIDDELILSGANLSEEYFTDRIDRYMSFIGGANGLVDFYSDLIDILYDHSKEYDPTEASSNSSERSAFTISTTEKINEKSLTSALNQLFDGSNMSANQLLEQLSNNQISEKEEEMYKKAFAFAIPTIQPSQHFVTNNKNEISFPQDMEVISNMLLTAWSCYPNSSVYISSAYLNLTPFFMSVIGKFGSTSSNKDDGKFYGGASILLSASPTSHGFKPKKEDDAVNGSGRGWIPSAFLKLAEDIYAKISQNGGKILLYDREGFTFHAKGIWVTSGCCSNKKSKGSYFDGEDKKETLDKCEILYPENDLITSVIGSSNFGARSEKLDWESNCIFIMNPSVCDKRLANVKTAIAGDWNNMLKDCVEIGSRKDLKSNSTISVNGMLSYVATQVARKFF